MTDSPKKSPSPFATIVMTHPPAMSGVTCVPPVPPQASNPLATRVEIRKSASPTSAQTAIFAVPQAPLHLPEEDDIPSVDVCKSIKATHMVDLPLHKPNPNPVPPPPPLIGAPQPPPGAGLQPPPKTLARAAFARQFMTPRVAILALAGVVAIAVAVLALNQNNAQIDDNLEPEIHAPQAQARIEARIPAQPRMETRIPAQARMEARIPAQVPEPQVTAEHVPSGSTESVAIEAPSMLASDAGRLALAGRYAEALLVYRQLSPNPGITAMIEVLEQKLPRTGHSQPRRNP